MNIKQINESIVKLNNVDQQLNLEIDNYFAKFVLNFLHVPAYKNGIWDGKEHFYNSKTKTLPLGLLDDLKSRFGKYIEEEEVFPKKQIDLDFESFYRTLNLKEGYEIRDYQQLGFELSFQEQKIILKAATGAGKSLIIWLMTKYAREVLGMNFLIIVPQIMLVEQLYADFEDYGGFKDGDIVGRSTAKKLTKTSAKKLGLDFELLKKNDDLNQDLNKDIVISTWQTLQHKDADYFERFDGIIMDEVHLLDGKTIQKIIQSCKNAFFRIGLTGTLKQDPKSDMMYKSIFHKTKLLITSRELIDRGFAAEVVINPVTLFYPTKPKYNDFNEEVAYLRDNDERYEYILRLIKAINTKDHDNNTLVLFRSVTNGFWEKLAKDCSEFAKDVYVIHGSTKAVDREIARLEADKKNGIIIIASYDTFSTGVNIKRINYTIFAESYGSMIKVVQSIGRGMRLYNGKNKVQIIDINDKFRVKNFTYKHYLERLKIYEEFEYIVKPEKIQKMKFI